MSGADRAASPGTRRPLVFAAVLLAMFLAAVELTVVSTAMPTVVGDLGGLPLYAWVFTAYLLASTTTVPIFGKLADVYGRKRLLMLGITLFLLGSTACGLAQSLPQLIAARVLQGLGAGAMQPLTLTLIGDLYTLEERARRQGLIGAVWGIAGLAGPMLGGAIVHALSWRWVFFFSLPFGLLSLGLIAAALHERIEPRPRALDLPGAALLAGTVLALLLGADGHLPRALLLPAAALLLVAFVAVEARAAEPVLPLPLFRTRLMAASSAASALLGAAMLSTVTYVPLYVQGVLGGTPTQAGGAVTPMVLGWPVAATLAGRLLPRLGSRFLVRLGLGIAAVATALLPLLLREGGSLGAAQLVLALFGVGLGFANTSLLIAVQSGVSWEQRGVATASTMFFRTVGGTVAVGLLGSALDGALATALQTAFVAIAILGTLAFAAGLLYPAASAGAAGSGPDHQAST